MRSVFIHEKLDPYRDSLAFAAWVAHTVGQLSAREHHVAERLAAASLSIPLAIARACAESDEAEREKTFRVAHGQALECAVCLDVLVATGARSELDVRGGKERLGAVVGALEHVVPLLETLAL